jgi:hypothetical protein
MAPVPWGSFGLQFFVLDPALYALELVGAKAQLASERFLGCYDLLGANARYRSVPPCRLEPHCASTCSPALRLGPFTPHPGQRTRLRVA